jgi:hypothetical protein
LFLINTIAISLAATGVAQTGTQPGTKTSTQTPSASPSAAKPASSKSGKASSKKGRRSRRGAWKRKGQQVIKPERATEIQEALIRENYLTGKPTGKWDTRTQAAMVKYQADNGWQSKVTPDSRALIKLGLGPNYAQEQMLNAMPKSAVAANASGGSSSTAAPKR